MGSKRTVIITGANTGLGYECARNIAGKSADYTIVLACRNKEKCMQARNKLAECTGNKEIVDMQLDVSSLASVREFVRKFKGQDIPPLFGIICNAGINGNYTGLTRDQFDIIFETNHLGHFLLVNLLLPSMQADGRILSVSSDMHNPPGGELTWPGVSALAHPEGTMADDRRRYSFSKLCNLYFIYELDRRLRAGEYGITANAFNPGLMTDTDFAVDKSRFTEAFLKSISDRIGSLKDSSAFLSKLMVEREFDYISGRYYDRGKESPSSQLSYSRRNAAELWEASLQYTELEQEDMLPGLYK